MIYTFRPYKREYTHTPRYWIGVFDDEYECTRDGSKAGKCHSTEIIYIFVHGWDQTLIVQEHPVDDTEYDI